MSTETNESAPASATKKATKSEATDVRRLNPVAVHCRDPLKTGAKPVRVFRLDAVSAATTAEERADELIWHPAGVFVRVQTRQFVVPFPMIDHVDVKE